MSYVGTREMLLESQKGKYAIGAFNVENMEMVMAVVKAAEELHSPVILQTTPSTVSYAGFDLYHANVKAVAESAGVPVALHLDHGNSFDLAIRALRSGYTSVMIDGSKLHFDENIALTKKVVEACTPAGITVEAELGKIGGKEDGMECDTIGYTEPDEAEIFVKKTGISSLAVAIGTAHGIYKGKPKLDTKRLALIKEKVSIPLVLHGASGIEDEDIRECVRLGICKVNFATELRIAYSNGIKHYLADKPETFDPKKYCAAGMEYVTKVTQDKIRICGSVDKA